MKKCVNSTSFSTPESLTKYKNEWYQMNIFLKNPPKTKLFKGKIKNKESK